MKWLLVSSLLIASTLGCDEATEANTASVEAVSFEDHECAACGMIVRDQPAPRGQLVHHDGTRVFFCAIFDLVAYVGAPSPHGDPDAIHVEVMSPDADPSDVTTDQKDWRSAHETTFVVGAFQRPVMGRPVLTFASESEGRAAAQRLDGTALTWEALQTELDPNTAHSH